jgi:hypothetical protein
MTAVLHKSLPLFPWEDPRTARLPGIQPLQGDDWLCRDEAFAGQMALRDRLIAGAAPVHALLPEAQGAAAELYALCLQKLAGRSGYSFAPEIACRPDGVDVPLTPAAPLLTLGRLVQEDLCLLQPGPGGDYRQRRSRKFGPAVKMDRMMKVTIRNDKTKEPFARILSPCCA